MKKRCNAEYEIIGAIEVKQKLEVVIGYRRTKFGDQYVTWECLEKSDYYWGHYFNEKKDAIQDFCNRVNKLAS